MPAPTIGSGSVLDGRYHLLRRIGGGGMGTVFEAEDLEDGALRAVKVMRVGGDERRGVARSAREAKLAAFIEHPNVVQVHDVGAHDDPPCSFLVMERLYGEDLGARSARLGAIGAEEVAWILREAASALDAAHARHVVHRDLKPTNLFLQLVDQAPKLKILDFGTAKLLDDTTSSETTHSLGTPIYMAPEQFLTETPTPAVDIFGLGMTAFRLLTGHHYYELETGQCPNTFALGARLMRGIPEGAMARAHRYGIETPEAFDTWFARCTSRAASDRFPTATEAAEAFCEALGVGPTPDPSTLDLPVMEEHEEPEEEHAVETRSLGVAERRATPRRPPWAGAALVGLAVAGLGLASKGWSSTESPRARWLRAGLGSAIPDLSSSPPTTQVPPTSEPAVSEPPSSKLPEPELPREAVPTESAVPPPAAVPRPAPPRAAPPSRADLWTRE